MGLHFDDGDVLGCTFLIKKESKYCKGCCSFGHLEEECFFKEKKNEVGVNARRNSKPPKGSAKGENASVVDVVVPKPNGVVIGVPSEKGAFTYVHGGEEGTKPISRKPPVSSKALSTVSVEEDIDSRSEDTSSTEDNDSESDKNHRYISEAEPYFSDGWWCVWGRKSEKRLTKPQKKEAKTAQVPEVVNALKALKRWLLKDHAPRSSKKDVGEKDKVSS